MGLTPDSEPGAVKASSAGIGVSDSGVPGSSRRRTRDEETLMIDFVLHDEDEGDSAGAVVSGTEAGTVRTAIRPVPHPGHGTLERCRRTA